MRLELASCLLLLSGCHGVISGGGQPAGGASSAGATGPLGGSAVAGESGGGGGSTAASMPGPAALPRLTVAQYRNAIERLFGPGIDTPELESDNNPDFFSVIGAAREAVTENGVALYYEAAKAMAKQVSEDEALRASLLGCSAPAVDDDCIGDFLDTTGTRLFRRPLSTDEVARYAALFRETAEGNVWQGLRFCLTALLSSPQFLYREERTVAAPDQPGGRRFDDYALASRLSFLTANDGPDDELLDLARHGQLAEPVQLVAQLDRLYPVALERGLPQFFGEYLELAAAGQLDFPGFEPAEDEALSVDMRAEVLALARDAARPQGDFRRLFDTRDTYLTGRLAKLYGIAAVVGDDLTKVALPTEMHRAGLLTTGAFLTAESAQDRTKPTNRGFYVQVRLLCTPVPDPPDNVPLLEDAGDPAATSVRQVLERHRADPSCAGCHALMDPIGLGLEDFDQFGRYRTTYPDGSPVDAATVWNERSITGAAELGAELGRDPKFAACIARQLFRYANARREQAEGEEAILQKLTAAFEEGGYDFQRLMQGLVASDSFRFASVAPGEEPLP